MQTLNIQALLLDMDGTLVDSTAVVCNTWGRFARRHGLNLDDILHGSHGRRTEETVEQFAPAGLDITGETARIVAEELEDTQGIIEVPGALALLRSLKGKPWAVVTSASRELAQRRMKAAGLPLPDLLISAEDVSRGKPAPEGYIKAALCLGLETWRCLAIEDARAGLDAAHAAGCQVLAVATTLKAHELKEERWVTDLRQLRVEHAADGQQPWALKIELDAQSLRWPPVPHPPALHRSGTDR